MALNAESLEFILTADPSRVIGAFQQVGAASEKSLGQAESNIQRIGSSLARVGAGGIGAGGLLTQIGSKEQEAANQLEAAVGQVGQSYADYADDVQKAEQNQVHFGNTAAQTQAALTTLTLSYGDTGKALDRMQLVTDLAARKHISLGEAATMVAKAHGGAARLFREFGIQVGQNTSGTKDYDGALDQLSQKLQGQAAASADTAMGKFRALRAEIENHIAAFGAKYGPAVLAASSALTVLGASVNVATGWFGRLRSAQVAAAEAAQAQAAAAAEEAAAREAATAAETAATEALYDEQAKLVASNERLTFSQAEVDAAMQARAAAEAQALVGNQALIAADEEATAATEGLTAAHVENAAATEADGAASAGASISLLSMGAAAAPLLIALPLIKIGLDGNAKAAQQAKEAQEQYTKALEAEKGAVNDAVDSVTAHQLATRADGRAVVESGIDLRQFYAEVRRGAPGLRDLQVSLLQGSDAAAEFGGKLDTAAKSGDPLIVKLDQMYRSGQLTNAQILAITGTAGDLGSSFGGASTEANALAGGLSGVDAEGGNLDETLKTINDQAKDAADQLNAVAEASHQLLSADLQAKYAPIDISDAQARAEEARKKLQEAQAGTPADSQAIADANIAIAQAQHQINEAMQSGDTLKQAEAQNQLAKAQASLQKAQGSGPDPEKIAQAQRDYDRATLDVTRAVNNAAGAEESLMETQQKAAGVKDENIDKNSLLLTALQDMEQFVSGPYKDALDQEIVQQQAIVDRLTEQHNLNNQIHQDQVAQADLTPEQLRGTYEPYTPVPPDYRVPGQPGTGRAIGGSVEPGDYMVGEKGPERLSITASGRGYIWTAAQTAAMTPASGGGSSQPQPLVGEYHQYVYGVDSEATASATVRGLRRLQILRPR